MSKQDALKGAHIFAGFEPAELEALAAAATPESATDGHVFVRMGEPNSRLYVVSSGTVLVERMGTTAAVDLARMRAGDTFGELSFIDGSRATATVRALGPAEVLAISHETLEQLLEKHPALLGKFWQNMALELKRHLVLTNDLVDHYVDMNRVLVDNPELRDTLLWS